jgi:hypothetical protein
MLGDMLVTELNNLPSEDHLSDALVSLLRRDAGLAVSFAEHVVQASLPDASFKLYTRKQLSAIPGIPEGPLRLLKPDIVLMSDSHVFVFENKRDATLKPEQLPSYIEAIQALATHKATRYFLIAPRTSKYQNLPSEVSQLSWDQVYDFLKQSFEGPLPTELETLGRFRLGHFQYRFDKVLSEVREQFGDCTYSSDKPTSDYHGVHFTLKQSSDVVFALALFLQSPSYAKLFPFKARFDGELITFNSTHPKIRKYKEALLQVPGTRHQLKSMYPGYVFDMDADSSNEGGVITRELMSLVSVQCLTMLNLYHSIR